jgi:deoxyribodipyrimidine photolyase
MMSAGEYPASKPLSSLTFRFVSNWGNWQYQAGVGNDPRSFRQFNQIKQANDYDADAEYILTWIPELRQVDRRFAHTPWRKSRLI